MKARLKCEKPEEIEYTVTITMSAKEWERLRGQLETAWPASELSYAIDDLLAQARKIYWAREPE
jgi:hypothetical protein